MSKENLDIDIRGGLTYYTPEDEPVRKPKPISKRFLFSFFLVVTIMIVYIIYPGTSDDTSGDGSQSYSYNNNELAEQSDNTENTDNTVNNTQEVSEETQAESQIAAEETVNENNENGNEIENYNPEEQKTADIPKDSYNDADTSNYDELLDELAEYPSKSEYALKSIVSNLLKFKGYPVNSLKIKISDLDQSSIKSMNDYMLANFDMLSGELNISKKLLYDLDIKVAIAVLAHELDHFDKMAQICKSIGVEQLKQIFLDNGASNFNKQFYAYVSFYANIENFDKDLYVDALKRFVSQRQVDRTSLYSDFYKISENMRNPLEVSAYEKSDYVYKHFGISLAQGDMKRIASVFNKADWAIYEITQKWKMLSHERLAIFDYLYAYAISETMPEFKSIFHECINQKDGDLTNFWAQFKEQYKSFYKQGKMTNSTAKDIIMLLNVTTRFAQRGLHTDEIAKAVQYRINTLKSNISYLEDVDNLKKTSINYLEYISNEHIKNPKQELNAILIILCIENELYTNNNSEISLDRIKIPKEIMNIYNADSQNSKFSFIYNNTYFQETNYQGRYDETLVNLLNKSRLSISANNQTQEE